MLYALILKVIRALQLFLSLNFNNIFMLSDLQSCLLDISSDSFKSFLSPLILIIKFLIYRFSLKNEMFKLLWAPTMFVWAGRTPTDATEFHKHFPPIKISAFDLLLMHYKLLRMTPGNQNSPLSYLNMFHSKGTLFPEFLFTYSF